jgi:hypothetical protein
MKKHMKQLLVSESIQVTNKYYLVRHDFLEWINIKRQMKKLVVAYTME